MKGFSLVPETAICHSSAFMPKDLKSLQHPLIKHWVKIRDKKSYRETSQTVLITGEKICKELAYLSFKALIVQEGYQPPFPVQAQEIVSVSLSLLKKITGLENPEPIAAEVSVPKSVDLSKKQRLLVLDGITDPGNMGTLLRSALALGWEGVVITPSSVDPFNDKALRAAKGASFKLPLHYASWEELQDLFSSQSWRILAADVKGAELDELDVKEPVMLVLGNEAHGISSWIKERATTVCIPMEKDMESLNVAAAGAILMYALRR